MAIRSRSTWISSSILQTWSGSEPPPCLCGLWFQALAFFTRVFLEKSMHFRFYGLLSWPLVWLRSNGSFGVTRSCSRTGLVATFWALWITSVWRRFLVLLVLSPPCQIFCFVCFKACLLVWLPFCSLVPDASVLVWAQWWCFSLSGWLSFIVQLHTGHGVVTDGCSTWVVWILLAEDQSMKTLVLLPWHTLSF